MDQRVPVAIVTGGASGLGRSVVERLISQQIHVAIVDVSKEAGQIAEELDSKSDKEVRFFQADVSDKEQALGVVKRIYEHFERVDYLVNAAGIITRAPAAEVAATDLKRVIDINLIGSAFMCQAVYPYMKEVSGGSIVNFGSMLAHYGSKNLLTYAASKGGVLQVTQCLAVEWAGEYIRVNSVSPGYIETPLSSGATKDPVFKERILSRTPQRRFGKPEEVAAVVYFLLSDEASFVTGVDIPIDGGLLAGDPALFPPA
ncbi:SDR family NAD(P)-dependent oxidoreductase [Bacillus horti]|uniref:2-deoxy-D-gluconate 3-dehydrogenase n=1 Tax=Caldalkalibacillus horti TaxID=77523 RepID=A0ABT9VVP9_9BACI|nr:SDR family oxidoreductase [Bacillus horti]MDQ0165042.1 2-deoxy-D-gluconate 3-dehydrogenase [Bacillus horti]